MTIRDVFATHAMAALITSTKVNKEDGQMTDADYAHLAYIMADAMLRQREVIPKAMEQADHSNKEDEQA